MIDVIIYLSERDVKKEKQIKAYCKKNNYRLIKIFKGIGCSRGIDGFDLTLFEMFNYILNTHKEKDYFWECKVIGYDLKEFSFLESDQSAICNMLFSLDCELETLKEGIWCDDFYFETKFKKNN